MSEIEIVLTPAPEITIEPGGAPGPAGKSAYQVWLDEGNTGTEQDFLDSLQGEDGAPGPTAVSADAGNAASLGTDSLIFVDGSDFATAAQGAKADTAVQPGSLGDLAAQDSVTVSQIEITGTPDGTKFLRDDGSWQTVASGGGGGAWGEITGTLSDQTDLQAALDAKVDGDASDFATASQGALADSAVQPGDLATVATSGDYDDLSDKPTLGTAAALNVASSGNAALGEVVKGNDTRLSDARTPTTHTHTASQISDFNTAADARVVAGITGKLDTSAAPELIRDTMGTALVAGTNITITVNDAGDTITIAETVSPIAAGSAMNPHTTKTATRNSALSKNFWQYSGVDGVDNPTNAVIGDEWTRS